MRNIKSNKIVIKVGTSTLTKCGGELNIGYIEKLVATICELRDMGKQVVLVTSGAIAVGVKRLGLPQRPTDISQKQSCAAVGQCLLMAVYDRFFRNHNQVIGQVLITKDCIDNEKKHVNAINAFSALLNMGVIPIVNENDTVAIDEIVVGDNDTLAAYVANMIDADLLILLTDVDGFYDENGKIFSEITETTPEIKSLAKGGNGAGGMTTKLIAAEISNAKTIIMNGEKPNQIHDAIKGGQIGTYFNIN